MSLCDYGSSNALLNWVIYRFTKGMLIAKTWEVIREGRDTKQRLRDRLKKQLDIHWGKILKFILDWKKKKKIGIFEDQRQ